MRNGRVFQAAFRGVQRAIEEKAREYGVPVIYVDPKNTSRLCPVHGSKIVYGDESRIGKCERGGEIWHRDVAAVWNLLLKACASAGCPLSWRPSSHRVSCRASP
nr:transposase [Desulfurococcus amylolyticus]